MFDLVTEGFQDLNSRTEWMFKAFEIIIWINYAAKFVGYFSNELDFKQSAWIYIY